MGKWEDKDLGKVVQIIGGGTPSKQNQSYFDGSIPWATVRDMNVEIIDQTEYSITEQALQESSANIIKKGNIVIATRVGLGKVSIAGVDLSINQDLKGIEPMDGLNHQFLFYWFKSQSNHIIANGTGATVKGVKLDFIKSLKIPLPPHSEQKRIVSKLDALFERIDQSIDLLEENLKHTQALMSSVLDEFYKEGDTPLSAVVELNPKKSQVRGLDEELEVTFLPMAELNEFQISFEKKQAKPLKEVYKGYTYFQDDDVLLAKVTPCFENQKGGLATGLTNGIGFGSSEYHVLRPSEKEIPEWIYYAIMSREFNNEGKRSMTGAVGLKRVPSSFVENWKIPIPSIEDQKKSIRRIQAIFDKSKESIIQFDQKLNNLKALKSSLLDKAFKGEL